MRFAGPAAAALLAVTVIASPSRAQSPVAEAESHLRQACEIIWANAKPYQIERCTRRAMAALGNEEQLRNNELKRLLIDSEEELEACKEELADAQAELEPVKTAKAARDPKP